MESSMLSLSSDTNSFIISSPMPTKTVQVSRNTYSPRTFIPSSNSTENNSRTNTNLDLTTSIKISPASTLTSIDSANANVSLSASKSRSNSKRKCTLQSSNSSDQINSKDVLSKLLSDKQGHQSNLNVNNNDNMSDYKISSKVKRIFYAANH